MEQSSPRRSTTFLQDVGVNVLANILAAPVIYLLGAAIGLFPRSPEFLTFAVIWLLIAGLYTLGAAEQMMRTEFRRDMATRGSLVVLGALFIVIALTQSDLEDPYWWTLMVFGTLSLVPGCVGVVHLAAARRSTRVAERRITGLSWIELP